MRHTVVRYRIWVSQNAITRWREKDNKSASADYCLVDLTCCFKQ